MNRFLGAAAALLVVVCSAGCGYVGDPMPPLANVPLPVKDLAAIQRGGRIIVQFTVPVTTTESHPIPPPLQMDLRAGTAEQFEENQWAASAKRIPASAASSECGTRTGQEACPTARYEIPAADWTAKEVIFGVRAVAGNGKHSTWSNFVVVPVVAPPQKPSSVELTATQQGVRVTWQTPGTDFRVFRKSGDEAYAQVASVQTASWTDTGAEFGTRYSYEVQSMVKVGNGKEAESELSDEASIVPRDIFPPAVPKGLQGSGAPHSIELNWEQNAEGDLNGYRVYRAEGSGAMEKIADVSVVPSYSDRKVESGKTYHYSISAVDQAGNESARSAAIDVPMQ